MVVFTLFSVLLFAAAVAAACCRCWHFCSIICCFYIDALIHSLLFCVVVLSTQVFLFDYLLSCVLMPVIRFLLYCVVVLSTVFLPGYLLFSC